MEDKELEKQIKLHKINFQTTINKFYNIPHMMFKEYWREENESYPFYKANPFYSDLKWSAKTPEYYIDDKERTITITPSNLIGNEQTDYVFHFKPMNLGRLKITKKIYDRSKGDYKDNSTLVSQKSIQVPQDIDVLYADVINDWHNGKNPQIFKELDMKKGKIKFGSPKANNIYRNISSNITEQLSDKEETLYFEFVDYYRGLIANIVKEASRLGTEQLEKIEEKPKVVRKTRKKSPKKTTKKKKKEFQDDFVHKVISLQGYPFENKVGYKDCLNFYTKISKNRGTLIAAKEDQAETPVLFFSPLIINDFTRTNLKVSPLPISLVDTGKYGDLSWFWVYGEETIGRMKTLLEIENDTMLSEESKIGVGGALTTPFTSDPLVTAGSDFKANSTVRMNSNLYDFDYVELCKRINGVHPFNFFKKLTVNQTNFLTEQANQDSFQNYLGLINVNGSNHENLNGLNCVFTDRIQMTTINLSNCIDRKIYEKFKDNKEKYDKAYNSVIDWENQTSSFFRSFEYGSNDNGVSHLAIQEAVKKGEIYVPVGLKGTQGGLDTQREIGDFPFYSNSMNMHIFQAEDINFPDMLRVLQGTVEKINTYTSIKTEYIKKSRIIKLLNNLSAYLFAKGILPNKSFIIGKATTNTAVFTKPLNKSKTERNFNFDVVLGIVEHQMISNVGIYINFGSIFDMIEGGIDIKEMNNAIGKDVYISESDNNSTYNAIFIDLNPTKYSVNPFQKNAKLVKVQFHLLTAFLDYLTKIPFSEVVFLTQDFKPHEPLLVRPERCGYFDKAILHLVMPTK